MTSLLVSVLFLWLPDRSCRVVFLLIQTLENFCSERLQIDKITLKGTPTLNQGSIQQKLHTLNLLVNHGQSMNEKLLGFPTFRQKCFTMSIECIFKDSLLNLSLVCDNLSLLTFNFFKSHFQRL